MAKILYLVQYFSTGDQPGGVGYRHFKHTEALAEAGHEVTLVTTGKTTLETDAPTSESLMASLHPNIRLCLIPCRSLTEKNVISRIQDYFEFSLCAFWAGLMQTCKQHHVYDVVQGSSPSILVALVACLLAGLNRARFVFEVRDIWSAVLSANQFIRNPHILAWNVSLERWLYRRADQIIVLSQAFEPEIIAAEPRAAGKIHFVPNGVDFDIFETPELKTPVCKLYTAEHPNRFNVVYAGAFSNYTNLDCLLDTAQQLKEESDIRFHLVGAGYELARLKARVADEGLTNVTFYNAMSRLEIIHFLRQCDLAVISLRGIPIFKTVLPTKLLDYLAVGRPILACMPDGEVGRILRESGTGQVVAPESPQDTAQAVRWFFQNREQGRTMGYRGETYVRLHFNRHQVLVRYLELFEAACEYLPSRGLGSGYIRLPGSVTEKV